MGGRRRRELSRERVRYVCRYTPSSPNRHKKGDGQINKSVYYKYLDKKGTTYVQHLESYSKEPFSEKVPFVVIPN